MVTALALSSLWAFGWGIHATWLIKRQKSRGAAVGMLCIALFHAVALGLFLSLLLWTLRLQGANV